MRVLLILPCSLPKNPDSFKDLSYSPQEEHVAILDLSEEARESILEKRHELSAALSPDSKFPVPALDRYNGGMYTVCDFRRTLARTAREGNACALILSGYHGIVTASERILKYDKKLDVDNWTRHRLPEAISELIEAWKVTRAIAFLNAVGPHHEILRKVSGYRNIALYSVEGNTNPNVVYPALGKAIIEFVRSGCRENVLDGSRVAALTIHKEEL